VGKYMSKFYCSVCQKSFESQGIKREWKDHIYGPCKKLIATCPTCKTECDEFRQKSSSKKGFDFDSYVSNLRNQGGGRCNPGGGCCG
jgi:hypothetical protein